MTAIGERAHICLSLYADVSCHYISLFRIRVVIRGARAAVHDRVTFFFSLSRVSAVDLFHLTCNFHCTNALSNCWYMNRHLSARCCSSHRVLNVTNVCDRVLGGTGAVLTLVIFHIIGQSAFILYVSERVPPSMRGT